MADTGSLVRQHDEIVALFAELASHEHDQDIMDNAMALSLTLSQLAAKMYFHILAEERILYSALLLNKSESVLAKCGKYSAEMDNIVQKFRRYRAAYSRASKIIARPDKFRLNTALVATVIIKRFENEQLGLYPILERLCRNYHDL